MKLTKLSGSDILAKKRIIKALLIWALVIPAANKLILGAGANVVQYYADSYQSAAGTVFYRALTLISSIADSCAMCVCACIIGYSIVRLGAAKSTPGIIIFAISPVVTFALAALTTYLLIISGLHNYSLGMFRDVFPYYALSSFFGALLYYLIIGIGILVFSLCARKDRQLCTTTKKGTFICASVTALVSIFSSAADVIAYVRDNYFTFGFNFVFSYIIIPLFCAAAIFFLVTVFAKAVFAAIEANGKTEHK